MGETATLSPGEISEFETRLKDIDAVDWEALASAGDHGYSYNVAAENCVSFDYDWRDSAPNILATIKQQADRLAVLEGQRRELEQLSDSGIKRHETECRNQYYCGFAAACEIALSIIAGGKA